MQQVFPELLCIDATYKLLELRFPVYITLVEDGNGQSEIASFFLLLEETEASISADKDMTERSVFTAGFPQAQLLICLFHTFRTFRREITTDKMGIDSGRKSFWSEET